MFAYKDMPEEQRNELIMKLKTIIDDNIQTMTYIFEYSLEVKHENI